MNEPVLTIKGVSYVETKPGTTIQRANCEGCAFQAENDRRCGVALSRSPSVFGGDCMERDVVYAAKEKQA